MNWTLLFALPVFAMVSSIINIAAMSNRVNCDSVAFHREQDTPVAGSQPHSSGTFERFHVAGTRCRKRSQPMIDLCTRSSGELAPLTDGGGRELDLLHGQTIA